MVAMYFVGNSSTAKPLGVFTIFFFFTADNYCTCIPNHHLLYTGNSLFLIKTNGN